ncbi:hypothetical protein [Bacillus sp. FJAT-44742]|uniref:hypothetical protein n=1 Tax=Bacillus sp. FJAT-44742 TaxID=2014005 RepID=UPI000C247438|nr:hypothetical protein [Bacillus sp. FJAT-44742]
MLELLLDISWLEIIFTLSVLMISGWVAVQVLSAAFSFHKRPVSHSVPEKETLPAQETARRLTFIMQRRKIPGADENKDDEDTSLFVF